MVNGLWGKKIGMTSVFAGDVILPVTVVDTAGWFVLQLKNAKNDGYDAVQVGFLKPRYRKSKFNPEWLKNLNNYFEHIKELAVEDVAADLTVGMPLAFDQSQLAVGSLVDVIGVSKGHGYAGVVRRHNFGGGRASHGGKCTLNAPGSISFMRARGRVIKGKRMAGHMGAERKTVKNLEVVQVDTDSNVILIKGAIPGKSGSLVFVRKFK